MQVSEFMLLLTDISGLDIASTERLTGWLGEAEQRRLNGFVRAERRHQFVAGRALLRMALAELLQVEPSEISLTERANQSPLLKFPLAPNLGFSISHSGRWVACAARRVGPIGLDIERCNESRNIMEIAGLVFGPADLAFLNDCCEKDRYLQFYRMWCEYESKLKLGCIECPAYEMFEVPGCPKVVMVLASEFPIIPRPALTLVNF